MKRTTFSMALLLLGLVCVARADESDTKRVLSVAEKGLVGRWQGNEQKFKNGWRQLDFYIFAADGSYAVLILVYDPEEEKWKSPSKIDPSEGGDFEGEFRVFDDRVLVLNNWFAPRQLEFQIKGDELRLHRPMLDASWVMTRTKRFEWETPEMTRNLDEALSLTHETADSLSGKSRSESNQVPEPTAASSRGSS